MVAKNSAKAKFWSIAHGIYEVMLVNRLVEELKIPTLSS